MSLVGPKDACYDVWVDRFESRNAFHKHNFACICFCFLSGYHAPTFKPIEKIRIKGTVTFYKTLEWLLFFDIKGVTLKVIDWLKLCLDVLFRNFCHNSDATRSSSRNHNRYDHLIKLLSYLSSCISPESRREREE